MLDTAAVTNNANSKLCQLDLLVNARHVPSAVRMEQILRLALDYDRATTGSVGRYAAQRALDSKEA